MTNNKKELIAIDKALDVFQPRLKAQGCRHILIQSDNSAVVYNKAAVASLDLDLHHLLKRSENPGIENTTTDSLSRLELSRDYQIRKEVIWLALRKINFHPKVDLFARQSNRLLTSYCSLKKVRSKKASEVVIPERRLGNPLPIKWTGLNPLIHPLIPPIFKSLKKFAEEGHRIGKVKCRARC
jgi:hypothetical protein